jgi:hypothetical protein
VHPQLTELETEFMEASRRVAALERTLPATRWTRRPPDGGWSAIECVQHLNLTAQATLPRVRAAIEDARRLGGRAPARYRRDLFGWLLWRVLREPGRFKTRTPPAFVPDADLAASDILDTFREWQAEGLACVRACDGLPIHRVRIVSPFNARLRYSLFSALSILAVHQHRHLAQAEGAARADG